MARLPIQIKTANPTHAEAIARIYAPFVTDTVVSFEEEPPTAEETAHRLENGLKTHPWLVALSEGKVAGYAYASVHRPRASYRWAVDVSVYLAPEFRGKGIGTQLYQKLFEILRAQGFFSAYAGITLPNPASVALHESLGFYPVGQYEDVGYKLGAWHTTSWWQMELQPRPECPADPIPFEVLSTERNLR